VSIQRYVKAGRVHYRARVKHHGREVATQVFDRKNDACRGVYADVVRVLGLAGMCWGELPGLQVGDRIAVPGPGFRLQRSVLASSKGGELFVDTLKGKRSRTVPLVAELVPLVDAWTRDKQGSDWLFGAPRGGPLGEANRKRARSGGRPRVSRSGGRRSGCTTCGTPARRCGWGQAPTPRWCSGSWGTPRRR
jgi:integrase